LSADPIDWRLFEASVTTALRGLVAIRPQKAVDGSTLVFDDELRARINPINL
jgi:hypothetical protein